MSLIDFNSATINTRRYSGNGGNKYGVNFNDENWILKFPKSTQDLNNPKASYATSPLSEYLGSKIYESFGIPVHEVKLGFRKPEPGTRNKLVVACKDFLDSEQRLIEFKNTKNAQFFEGGNEGTSGAGTRLDEVLETIERSLDFIGFREDVRTRFWDMFVVDYVLGNNDRNNTNWGIIATDKQILGLSPVYDNGNSFFDKRNIDQFETRLPDELLLKEDAYETLVSAYVDDSGNHIHPSEIISSMAYKGCNEAIKRFVSNFRMAKVKKIFDEIPIAENEILIFPQKQKDFYLKLIEIRIKDIILPTMQRLSKNREFTQKIII